MRIAALSDSHVSSLAELPGDLVEELRRVDLIIHAGDYTARQLVDDLRRLGPFRGVAGNMDSMSIRAELPERDIVEVQGQRIGIIHGSGSPVGIAQRVRAQFADDVDAIVYGHSHLAGSEIIRGALVFNPGSATGRFPASYASLGILTIDEHGIRGQIVPVPSAEG